MTMRKIVVGLFMSLDGVVEGPGPQDAFERAGWTMPYFTPEIGQIIGEITASSDALLLGRVTYQGFQSSFEHQTDGMAAMLNNQLKYVVSSTLKTPSWNNSRLIDKNVVEEITKLKQQPGKDISMSGSIRLVQTLMEHHLIDECSLLLYPVTVGAGRRLFKDGAAMNTLKLVEAKPLSSGVIHLRYQLENKE